MYMHVLIERLIHGGKGRLFYPFITQALHVRGTAAAEIFAG